MLIPASRAAVENAVRQLVAAVADREGLPQAAGSAAEERIELPISLVEPQGSRRRASLSAHYLVRAPRHGATAEPWLVVSGCASGAEGTWAFRVLHYGPVPAALAWLQTDGINATSEFLESRLHQLPRWGRDDPARLHYASLFRQGPAPDACAHIAPTEPLEALESTVLLLQRPHQEVSVRRCSTCGRSYLVATVEIWDDSWTYIAPATDAELAMLTEDLSWVLDLVESRPHLLWPPGLETRTSWREGEAEMLRMGPRS